MAEVIMGVEGMNSGEAQTEVMNAMRKYSGVLDVEVSPSGREIRVRYDPNNILAQDLKHSIEQEGYDVSSIRQ